MNKYIILVLTLFFAPLFSASAQSISRSNEREEMNDKFTDRLWYGGSFSLGLNGTQNINYFTIGASPMVGYKIKEFVSVGPRITYSFHSYRINTGNGVRKERGHEYGIGAFNRFKFLRVMFSHLEVNYTYTPYRTGNWEIFNVWEPALLLGLGYNSGGGEIYLLYDFLADTENAIQFPIELRFGFTIFF